MAFPRVPVWLMTSTLPEGGNERASRAAAAAPAKAPRVPWRPVGASVVSTGIPAAAGMIHPVIGAGMAIAELAIALTVIGTALFGSQELSERAFRLLRWIANRAEPPAPS